MEGKRDGLLGLARYLRRRQPCLFNMMRIQIGDAIVKSCSDVNDVDLSMRVVVCVKGNVQLD